MKSFVIKGKTYDLNRSKIVGKVSDYEEIRCWGSYTDVLVEKTLYEREDGSKFKFGTYDGEIFIDEI